MTENVKQDSIGKALGQVATGIFILTTGKGDQATGMLASFVQQVGFEPPLVVASVHRKRALLETLRASGSFAINICHTQNNALLKHFAKGFAPGQPAFEGIATAVATTGTPVLPEALAYLDCVVRNEVEAGDHIVFLAEVVDGTLCSEGEAMTRIRKNGFDY